MIRFSPLPLRPLATCAVAAVLLAGCAADYSTYPSLARRPAERAGNPAEQISGTSPAERVSGTSEVVAAAPALLPPPPPSPDLIARLGQLSDQAQAAHSEFSSRRAEAQRLVSANAGASVGGEGWAQASVALAGLETTRSQAMIALADLDAIYVAESVAGSDVTAIAATRDRVIGWIGEEDQVLAELRGRIAT
ncbi:MAG: hypothetical protein JWQ16_221 [Novosphingobium sp.]|nr:hypothetical protein [Novosphingobium sp.]